MNSSRRARFQWLALLISVAVLGCLVALLLAPVRNEAVSSSLGATLRAVDGTPLPLDRSAPR